MKDENFLKELGEFEKYYNFIEHANELISQKKVGSFEEMEMNAIIRQTEQLLHSHARKSISYPVSKQFSLKKDKADKLTEENKKKEKKKPTETAITVSEIEELPKEEEIKKDQILTETTENLGETKLKETIKKKEEPQTLDPAQFEACKKLLEKLKTSSYKFDTYYLPVVKSKSENSMKIDYSKIRQKNTMSAGLNMWILKVAGLNRGFGVEVFQTLDQLKKLIKDIGTGYQERIVHENKQIARSSTFIKTSKFVIQKYIERPLLYKGKKMDLRVWVMFSHENKPYVFRECYVRLSSSVYEITKIDEKFVHLTNNALQKYCDSYDEDETLKSTQDLESFIQSEINPDYNFKRDTWPIIRRQVKMTFNCCSKSINLNNKKISFEIFGFDFMLDEAFHVWLIETNTNPSITTPGVVLKAYVPRMVDDAFKLTIDKIFPVANLDHANQINEDKELKKSFPMPGYEDDENLWDLVDEKV